MNAYIISASISEKSMAEFEERSLEFPGVSIAIAPIRNYSLGNVASHIIGYVGKINEDEYKAKTGYTIDDYIGKTGIEYVLEDYLKGEDGIKQTDMSIDGTTTGEYVTKEAIGGNNVTLTIDSKIQQVTEQSLKDTIEKINAGGFGKIYNAKTGCAVVVNVKTGDVIAMCSYPNFEPQLFVDGISNEKWNEYSNKDRSALLNRAIQSAYAPGSIFKMVGAIAGLETGKIKATEKIQCNGIYPKGYNPKCWIWTDYHRTHGYLNVSEAIKNSCNCFFYEVGTRVGIEEIEKYATYFGLGQKTNIELPSEVSGTLAGETLYNKLGETWYYGNTLSAVIGQAENSFTPLQMTKYIAMLANGGKNIDLTLIKEIANADGSKISEKEIKQKANQKLGIDIKQGENLDINEDNLKVVLEGMKSVATETGGTAYSIFKDFDVEVGGKTGSAEAGENVNAWFAGFAPYENPEIAVVVFVENGGHGYYTAEVTRKIMEAYFGINEQITEDKTAKAYTEQQT